MQRSMWVKQAGWSKRMKDWCEQRANGQASGPVPTSGFLVVLYHSVLFQTASTRDIWNTNKRGLCHVLVDLKKCHCNRKTIIRQARAGRSMRPVVATISIRAQIAVLGGIFYMVKDGHAKGHTDRRTLLSRYEDALEGDWYFSGIKSYR